MHKVRDENIYFTIARVAKAMSIEVTKAELDCCHRLKKLPGSTEPRKIVVKFTSRWKNEEFLAARRSKRTLCVGDIGFEGLKNFDLNKTVYINESLTTTNRVLIAKCRDYKKRENIKYLWVRNCKIYVRKSENSKVFVISSLNDLRDVH